MVSKIIYFFNVLYIALIPSLALVVQGELKHEFIKSIDFLPENTWKVMNIALWVFTLILIAILVQTIKYTNNLKSSLSLLIGGPALGILISLLTGNPLKYTFFNIYLIEGFSFIMVLLIQFVRHRKRGLKDAGPIMVYLITPLLFLVFIFGFISSINLDFFLMHYSDNWDFLALAGCIGVGVFGMYKFVDQSDRDFRRENPDYFKEGGQIKGQEMHPLALTAMLIGIFTLMGSELLMKWDWLTNILQ